MQINSVSHRVDVKKLKLLVPCLFFSCLIYAQDIELLGRYGASFIGGETIEFVGKDSFYFGGFYCTWGVHGKGTCEIRNGYLNLYFENTSPVNQADERREAIIINKGNTDGFNDVEIFCRDYNDLPIPFATVMVEQPQSIRHGYMSDTSGRVHIRLSAGKPVTITTSAVSMESQKLVLPEPSDYIIKIYHRPFPDGDRELNHGEVFVYEIESITEDVIMMRPEKYTGEYRAYRKSRALVSK